MSEIYILVIAFTFWNANVANFTFADSVFCSLTYSSYDALHGVAGVYAKRIFIEELGASESSLLNCTPKVRWLL